MIEPHRKNETGPYGVIQKVTQCALSENKLWTVCVTPVRNNHWSYMEYLDESV